MIDNNSNNVIWIYNYFGYGLSYDGNVFDTCGVSPTLMASNCHGNVPKIIVIEDDD